ncbi:RasGTPase-activating protein [Dictyostelium discoideum AX4]|uniref:RasGTPase-activating protein n=1 Tax=Dictyostelium discoideum TaxID=44689 RepID=Q54I64_DICDI|nr:RasGTPase-activating protein [Dictyostelium discoideum AX4]EAL62943.1 RasGTPase-activating protein [Dictyostelium discoideum AX4]|eukprot:XP_636446.1 RasGTPase-activating protein [Dictyostelium discoideum AX4]
MSNLNINSQAQNSPDPTRRSFGTGGSGSTFSPGGSDSRIMSVNIVDIIGQQDHVKSEILAKNQKQLFDLKREISQSSKKNFTLERDIKNLDKKIALLIKNRITLEEIMNSGDIVELQTRTVTLKDKSQRDHYGQLFYLLQNNTTYIAQLAKLVKVGEIDNLLQTVMFTLYGNQYEEKEEHLLLSMFQKVLQEEFKEATSIGSLLRANTALTRMMTTYTRRGPGQQYLKQRLTKPLADITSNKDLILEVNPSTVYENYINEYETKTGKPSPLKRKVSPEECADNQNVKDIIKPRIDKLIEIGDQFLDSILSSVDAVPYGIRWICKQIRELVKQKFPQATRAQTCGLIGGFFLLRYINPAVVTPQAFMLVDAKLSNNTKRNLTFPAKMLQNLANNIMFGGVKEFFMEPLNVFLDRNKDRLNDFLESLTDVESLSDHLQLDKYLAMAKTSDITINITLNEMYFVHSLLEQHINSLAPDQNDPLRVILNDLGAAPPQLSRTENANVELKLTNRFAADHHNLPTSSSTSSSLNIGGSVGGGGGGGGGDNTSGQSNPEQVYNETKYLLITVLRSLASTPGTGDMGASLAEVAKHAALNKNQDIVDNIKKILVNVKKLSLEGYLKGEDDNFTQLRKDIVAELLNYETYISKTAKDIEKLKEVLSAIHQHNLFLQQQLDYYEKYLSNVRENCGTNASGSSDKKSKKDKDKNKDKDSSTDKATGKKAMVKKGPFKFSYNQMEKDGLICQSEVPEDRRSNIFFSFSSESPGIYDVVLIYRTTAVSEIRLQLDELLEMQSNGQTEYETTFFKLNVNLLLYVLNKTFIS